MGRGNPDRVRVLISSTPIIKMGIQRTRKTIWMALFRVKNDMNNAKKSVVVVANAGPTVVVVLGNAIDVLM